MRTSTGLVGVVGFFGLLAVANAQAPPASTAFDGTYRFISSANVNATYVDRNGRSGPCPGRRTGPLHVENGRVRYTTVTGYKLRGTVGPQGQLTLGLVAPSNSSNAGSQPLNLSMNGQIDSTGTARARQTSNSCSYDFVWQKER
ncbi:MAG: hypothetical protein WA417_22010 [Stellaceae bacterium]|jgi:hypothetical protein